MFKIIAASFLAVALAACSSMAPRSATMGNTAETKNSTDGNKSGNPAAVSPGAGGAGTGTGAGPAR